MATLELINSGTGQGAGDGTNAVQAAEIINENFDALNEELSEVATAVAGKAATANGMPTGQLVGQVLGVNSGGVRTFLDPTDLDLLTAEDGAQMLVLIDELEDELEAEVTSINTEIDTKVTNVLGVSGVWRGNQAAYDALTPDANTIYFITA